MNNVAQVDEKVLSKALKIDKKEIKSHLSGLVKQTVEETLNALLSEEADAICGARSGGYTSRNIRLAEQKIIWVSKNGFFRFFSLHPY